MDGLAIDRQRQDCEAIAEQRGWDVVHTYVDQSISASKKDVDRPDYDAMVASFERGEIDAIICWDLEPHTAALAARRVDRQGRGAGAETRHCER